MVLRTTRAEQTRDVARAIAPHLRGGDLVILDGPLGAGKTTFTQGIGEALGVRGPVLSPTFVISRLHPTLVDGPALAHVDAYRLNGVLDVEALDLDADLDDSVMVVEWGRDLVEQITDSHLQVSLSRPEGNDAPRPEEILDEPRTITLRPVGPRWDDDAVRALVTSLRPLGLGEES